MGYKLVKSGALFDSEHHTYTLDGKQLSGITSLLDRQLFKDKYSGIPKEVLISTNVASWQMKVSLAIARRQ
mgnify:CR=1 FL=1